ncbi:MAG TPA: DUF6279 family lipoprotein [Burkholderiales bacterium]|nr:DUF6279 family lipoprotein [Burkholderiales bacterium]
MRASKALLYSFLLVLLLGACSMVRLAYDNADSYLRWRLASYLDVHGEASDELDAAIERFLGWHRARALPQYARLAEDAASRVARGVSPEDLLWGYDSLVAQARESLRAGAAELAPLLKRLDAAQIAHIEARFAEDNRRFERDFLRGSEAERRERRARRIVERLEVWVGTLSQAQKERVRMYSASTPLLAEMRGRENRRLQAALLEQLRVPAALEQRLPELAAHWDRQRDPAYAAALADGRGQLFALLLDLERSLEPRQRARAVAELRRYAGEFERLAERAQ